MKLGLFVGWIAVSGLGCSGETQKSTPDDTSSPPIHPVFHTPVTGQSSNRPAVQVEILDSTEGWFTTAELYLAVQSSRFPSQAWVLLPINVGEFEGCRTRFVQLPFEVSSGDNLLFNLLDDDELTEEEEQRIVSGCRLSGYCVLMGGSIYAPTVTKMVVPVSDDAADILGETVLDAVTQQKFDNFGQAEYIVPEHLPRQPNDANRLTLLDDSRYARMQLRLYGPSTPLDQLQTKVTASPGEDAEGMTNLNRNTLEF